MTQIDTDEIKRRRRRKDHGSSSGEKDNCRMHEDLTYRILGACFEVYNCKGCGFLEPVYQECLEIELGLQEMPFTAQTSIRLDYKGHVLKKTYEPDFICFEKVLLEIKAVSALTDEHRAQVLNYMNATGIRVGLLVNFGHYPKLEYERFQI